MLRAPRAGRCCLCRAGCGFGCRRRPPRCECCTLATGLVCRRLCNNQLWTCRPNTTNCSLSCSITTMTSHILVCAMLARDLPYAVSCAALEKGLGGVARAMRRREVLQRADELVPHSVGRVLLALAASVADRDEGCKSVTCSAPAHDVHTLAGELRMHVQNITSATCSGVSNRSWLAAVCYRHMR